MSLGDFTDEEKEWAKRFIAFTNDETTINPGKAPTIEIWSHTFIDEIRKIKHKSNQEDITDAQK